MQLSTIVGLSILRLKRIASDQPNDDASNQGASYDACHSQGRIIMVTHHQLRCIDLMGFSRRRGPQQILPN